MQKGDKAGIIAENISFDIKPGAALFKGVSFALGKEKNGLVGRNGVGKTTLLRLIVGELEPDSGKIFRKAKVTYLPQDYQVDLDKNISDVLDGVDLGKFSEELGKFGMNLPELQRKLRSFSGGERMKIFLARMLAVQSNFLIMDEPTNNLDYDSRNIIYNLIRNWQGGMLVVSHDRTLLNLMDKIMELSPKGASIYGGNYDFYRAQKEIENEAAKHAFESAKGKLKKVKIQSQETREKQDKRSARGRKVRDKLGLPKSILDGMKKAAQNTSSRLKKIHTERIHKAESGVELARERIFLENKINVDLAGTTIPSSKMVLDVKNVGFSYDGNSRVLSNFSLSLHGPVRVSVAGKNGAGKTTLIKLILGKLSPENGAVTLGVERSAYLDQNTEILDNEINLIENTIRISGLDDKESRKWLARFLFRKEEVFKKAGELSGGERIRAALACIFAGEKPPQLLILDEPTNNLDLDSIERIESALSNFRGALIVISHDRSFLKNIGIKREIIL